MIALAAILAVTGATVGLGLYGVRLARTTSDLFVASRAVTPWWNAAAISGEYLSAASFLGIAGLQMKIGSAALWLPLGFTAGYLALLLFVAAPLRRFGAYTISDFAEARLGSPRLRLLAAAVVLAIAGFYLVPQLKGAGLTLAQVTGAPYWVGVVAVGAVVAVNVASGGMRGITYVQAFQYWTKTFAIALPACLLLIYLGGLPERAALFGAELPQAPAAGLTVTLDAPQPVTFPEAATYTIDGEPQRAAAGEERVLPAGELELPAGTVVPVADGIEAQTGEEWSRPVVLRRRHVARVRLLAAAGDVPRHDGAAAHPRPLLHQPGRARRAPHDRPRARPAGALLRVPARLRPARARARAAAVHHRRDRLGRARAAGGGVAGARRRAARRARRRGRVRRVHVDGVRPARVGRRHRVVRPAAQARRRRRGGGASGRPRSAAWSCRSRSPWSRASSTSRVLVGWAFALAASTFCPLLLLGIWWARPDRPRRGGRAARGRGHRHRGDLHRPRRRGREPDASTRCSRSRR